MGGRIDGPAVPVPEHPHRRERDQVCMLGHQPQEELPVRMKARLNMAQIELSALARQCSSRRIGTREELQLACRAYVCYV